MNLNLTLIGWLHSAACVYTLAVGGLVLWRLKGGQQHRRAGRRYVYASVIVNLSALGIYRLGGFNVFHVLAIATLASLAIAFASAYWQAPRKGWLRIHLTAIIFSYYQLVGGLINELFVRLPALQEQRSLLGTSQGINLIIFLMILAYFWGRTARPYPSNHPSNTAKAAMA
ncbi:DUF2306 domain-containing protein [Undibacterium sp.]|uniref:DUF2306 domain-containing protein n=1 Tax=Undibacterium sp. TaxID=1914977 RepID=UPI00374D6016